MARPSIRPDAEISGATGGSETIPKWGFGQKYIYNDLDTQTDQVQDFGRTMAHPSPPSDAEFSGAMAGSRSDLIFNDRGHFVTQEHQSSPLFQGESRLIPQSTWSHPFPRGARSPPFPRGTRSPPFLQGTVRSPPFLARPSRSPPLDFQNNHHVDSRTLDESQWPSLSPYKSGNSSQSFQNFPNQLPQTMTLSNPTNYDPGRKSPVKHTDHVSKRSRSPPGSPPSGATFGLHQPKRASTSPSISRSNGPPDSLAPQSSSINAEVGVSKPMYFPVSKRTKVPSVPSSDQVLQDDNDIQRETEAKAKRLARFKDDLSRTIQEDSKRQNQSVVVDRQKIGVEDSTDDDYDGSEPAGVIIGSCPDMCPESEREERERKGDLDRYERVDGDRNQSSKLLAVKKYNRTAEREAILIRPMPILQKTMDYLLNLLDKPYDDTFLALYNFLWDRMRAIRMDLRMQHIFNLEAMNMLEQMIRLHIIAMHELCEYTRGEGFSEGFDGHLNIEQMNKTSVELFQIYDDHRKRGINVATEREFRGYYALLKLDKHPGYKVEPAELSVDLAKMTPVMRQTPEVLFARDVARACRAGNFIAFFRLARRASYLQACLMHAHFSKLRTQALASLHSGLQNGQGIPVSQVAKWLGMEEEDIEGLVEYYGFSIKEFEEAYMVKEGPFLEVDNDYPVKCSKLVHKKKSKSMFEDVSAAHVELVSKNEMELLLLDKDHQQKPAAVEFLEPDDTPGMVIEEDMPDYEIISSPQDEIRTVPITQTEFSQKTRYEDPHVPPSNSVSSLQVPPSPSLFFPRSSPEAQQQAKNDEVSQFHAQVMSLDLIPAVDDQEEGLPLFPSDFPVEDEELRNTSDEDEEMLAVTGEGADNIEVAASYYDEEVAEAKLRLIIRIWKRRSSKIREMHEQKQLASKAALSSLSLGVPMWPNKAQHGTSVELNIDHAVSKWYQAQERSWSRLNVSDVVATTLHERNPAAKCLCWKVILFCHEIQEDSVEQLNAKSWLLSKLMPTTDEEHDTLISSPGLSIWRNWFFDQPAGDRICCLSVVKYTNFENLNGTVAGASAVVFLLTDGIRLDLQKNQLHKLLISVPCGSHLPLLILTEVCEENADASTIVKELELHPAHESRLGSISVVFLKKQQLLSDEQLRGGLKWLATESPPQPLLQCVKPRELVLCHLHSLLGEMNSHDVGPNNCISAFNEALDESMREIVSAAHANPTCWPCPEISLLEESSQEHHAVTQHLPKAGWSLAPTIEPIVRAINDCKLPSLIDDMSWLYRGSDVVAQQILQLEDCLINYFTESELSLAKEEASVVLQKSVQLRLNSSHYYIVPNWVKIFGRAFNWKLNKLAEGGTSFPVYTLIQHDFARELKNSEELHNQLLHPSLDEMVQVATLKDVPTTVCAGEAMEYWQDIGRDDEFVRTSDNYVKEFVKTSDDNVKNSEKGPLLVTEETDKLSKLLEKCEIKQNRIGKGLSIYF